MLIAAAVMAGCVGGTTGAPDAPGREESPASTARVALSHDHVSGGGDAAFLVEAPVEEATISLWWNGTTIGPEPGRIDIVRPDGTPLLAHEMPSGVAGFALLGKNHPRTVEGVPLEAGEWRVRFEGRGAFTAHVEVLLAWP